MHYLSIPSRTVQNLPISSVAPLSYVSEVNVPPLNLTAVTDSRKVVFISIICELDPKKATGCDKLYLLRRFIRTCPEAIAKLLTVLANKSISTGKFPELQKSANVTPVQKSKDSSVMTNFRPISVLPAFSNRLKSTELILHFLKYNSLSNFQSGFQPIHSTQDVLLHVVDCWRRAIDDGKYVVAGLLNLAKAFDCVDHGILLTTQYGIVGSTYLLI